MHSQSHSQRALAQLLSDMHDTLQQLFADCSHSHGERRGPLQQRLLLGLELLWKLEEQVVMPALREAEPAWAAELTAAAREIELMRDLSLRVQRSSAAERRLERDLAFAALEGMARVHCAHSEQLLDRAPAQGPRWPALHSEVQALLARWRAEIREHGDIEDEERDPVGLPPR